MSTNDPRNVSTESLSEPVAAAVIVIRDALLAAGNDSIAYAAGSTLGELVGALLRLPPSAQD
jgi:hypothetical protein